MQSSNPGASSTGRVAIDPARGRRRVLLGALLFLGIVAMTAVATVLSQSLEPSARAWNDAEFVVTLAPLEEGKLQILHVNQHPLFVLRPDAGQRQSIRELNDHVFDKRHSYFSPELGAYVYWGESTKWGCPLLEKTAADQLVYWPDTERTWLGGYWDPHCEVSYDYAGRTIATYSRAFNGYTGEWPNLQSPHVRVSGQTLTISFL